MVFTFDINSALVQAMALCQAISSPSADRYVWRLLPDKQNCGSRMRWECREHFPRNWLQRKPLVLYARAVMHIGIANQRWRENVPDIPGACATRDFTYLARGQ